MTNKGSMRLARRRAWLKGAEPRDLRERAAWCEGQISPNVATRAQLRRERAVASEVVYRVKISAATLGKSGEWARVEIEGGKRA